MKAPSRGLLWTVVVLGAFAATTAALDRVRASGLPTGPAQWVWASGADAGLPLAFVVAADFEIGELPARAELRLHVDPEYQVWINGTWVGAGIYELGWELDVWEVADRLQQGPNRLAIVARSPFGTGGLLAAVVAVAGDDERILAASDESWRVFDRRPAGVIEGWALLDGGVAPRVWGRPPIGRWGRPRLGPVRRAEWSDAEPVWGQTVSPVPAAGGDEGAWLVDFGGVAAGWVDLWGGPTADTRARWRAAQSLDELADAPPAGWVVPLRGDELWRSPRPRRLRYVWIDSAQPPRAARIVPFAEEIELDTPADDERRARDGLWGLTPPALPR